MHWIERYNKGIYQIYAGNTIEGFQPLDFFHFLPMWYDLWIERIIVVMDKLDVERKSYQELREFLPTPSSLRSLLQKIMPGYQAFVIKNPTNCRRVTDFFARMLMEACPGDPFAENSSPYHTNDEVSDILRNSQWQEGSVAAARLCGRLIAAAGSMAHGIYNDVVTDYGWDTYGPYQLGDEKELLIRHFPNLQTPELWPERFRASVKEVLIYGWYQGVRWKISGVGCHTLVKKGSPITGLKKYLITADGRPLSVPAIEALTGELIGKAEILYRKIRKKNFEELKQMVLLQECFQLKKLFDAAGIDWRPTPEMIARIENNPLLTGLIPHGKMVGSLAEYVEMFGIDTFAREVYQIHI